MFKRYSIFALVGAGHFIALIGPLSFIVGIQNLSAQPASSPRRTTQSLKGSCLICHGPDGAYRETLLMEHSELIEGGTVIPGNPNASELYKRLLGNTENGGVQMPFNQPQLPAQSIDTIRRWILSGAPDLGGGDSAQSIADLSRPAKYSRALRRTSTHFQRLTACLPATSHLPICITQDQATEQGAR